MVAAAPRQRAGGAVELTADPRFARRIVRLSWISAVALGVVCWLAAATTDAGAGVQAALIGGWLLMPLVLAFSLRRPRSRYALLLPASLVSLGLLDICLQWLPQGAGARAGWLLLTGGVWFGAGLGAWFWFRWLPVPAPLRDPFGPGRWALTAAHVLLVLAGLTLVGISAWR